jgi:hypothetical protein
MMGVEGSNNINRRGGRIGRIRREDKDLII